MRTWLTSFGAALIAAVVTAVVVVAIDDDGTAGVPLAPPSLTEDAASTVQPPAATAAQPIAATAAETPAPVTEPEGAAALLSPSPAVFDPVAIFQQAAPSVVSVETPTGGGSGFFVDTAGHVVTNYHVVAGVTSVTVRLQDGAQLPATVLGFDRANDLAVVAVDLQGRAILPMALGDSAALVVGEPVAAIGSPFGLEQTLTTGIVSAIGRVRPALEAGGRPQRGLIQTDAAINPGNSGGPLINAAGQVVGVNASAESPVRGSVGVGFAIASTTVSRFLPDLIAGREVLHPWMGIEGAAGVDGLVIATVLPGGPAVSAGLLVGDRLLAADGQALDAFDSLAVLLDTHRVGDVIAFRVARNGQEITIPVTLAAWPG